MMTMVSTFLSFLAGGLPKILQIFQDRQDKKHELALVAAQKERELALAERGFIAQARVLRSSVRPVVTYIFVLELVIINIAGMWYAWNQGVPFAIALENVFSEDEMLILSSIIAFWFGTQAFGKK